jgi:hypothetical protein
LVGILVPKKCTCNQNKKKGEPNHIPNLSLHGLISITISWHCPFKTNHIYVIKLQDLAFTALLEQNAEEEEEREDEEEEGEEQVERVDLLPDRKIDSNQQRLDRASFIFASDRLTWLNNIIRCLLGHGNTASAYNTLSFLRLPVQFRNYCTFTCKEKPRKFVYCIY